MWNKQRFSYLHHIPPAKLRTIFETTKFFSENLSDGIRADASAKVVGWKSLVDCCLYYRGFPKNKTVLTDDHYPTTDNPQCSYLPSMITQRLASFSANGWMVSP